MSIESIQLNKNSEFNLNTQIFRHFEAQVKSGELKPHERLPAVRKLAGGLGCNTVTVVSAYKKLEKAGLVYSKTGSGFYVCELSSKQAEEIERDSGYLLDDFQLMSRGQIMLAQGKINFASATPSSGFFPVDDFKHVLCEVLDKDGGKAFAYHESNGYKPLRQTICAFLENKYQIKSAPQSLQIISGAQQGIDIIAKAILKAGDYVIVENPTYPGALAVFQSRGVNVLGVPIYEDGMDIKELERLCRIYAPKLIYTMPNCQNPTTFSYSDRKKERLIDIAFRYKTYIIEDDSSSSILDIEGYSALKALDACDRVIYIKSFSKTLMPGLRLGFLLSPRSLFAEIMQAKHTSDITSSGFIQRAFDLYMTKGLWEKHLQKIKSDHRKKTSEIKALLPLLNDCNFKVSANFSGLSMFLTLPEGLNDMDFYNLALNKGLIVAPGRIFYVNDVKTSNIRISLAAADAKEIKEGIKILCECAAELKNNDTILSPMV